MKKYIIIAISVIATLGITFSSCDSVPATKIALTTEVDSISYSFGSSVGENLEDALRQMKILSDTFFVAAQYSVKIDAENDAAKKASLNKDMRRKIDSIQKANENNLIQFLQGFDKAINSRPSQASYNFGYSVGTQVGMQGDMMMEQFYGENSGKTMSKKAIAAAVSGGMQKKTPLIASSYLMTKSQEIQQREAEKMEAKGLENKAAGEKFLAENKAKEGVVTLESGIQYRILTEGNGEIPVLTDNVVCHYHGTLLDGTVFDSSVNRGEPATFPLQGVIPGWTEILQLMPVGSKWEVFLPYDKAYGERGTGGDIGAFETLKFDIELLEIEAN